MAEQPRCEICGDLMPPGEDMFKYHGYSGPCPEPINPLSIKHDEVTRQRNELLAALKLTAETLGDLALGLDVRVDTAYNTAHTAIAKAEGR